MIIDTILRRIAALAAAIPVMALAAPGAAWLPSDIAAVGPRTVPVNTGDYAEVRYVDVRAAGEGPGAGTREQPWKSLAFGLREIRAAAEQRVAVLVASGTYSDETVVLREYVDVYGGFDARDWSRDIFAHETVLDGQKVRRAVIGASHAVLDGFIVRAGRAYGHGGGMLCDGTSPKITNNRFEQCHTIAPEGFRSDRIHIQGHMGGALACLFEAVPVIANNLFRANWTEIGDGGALAMYGWHRLPGNPKARIEQNVFVDNRSGIKEGGRSRSSSGGAVVFSHEASSEFRHNVVAHNRAMGNSDAGGLYVEYYSSPAIENNWIVGNQGDDDGGGIYTMRLGEPLIRENLIAGNWTANGGVGGVRVSKEGRAQVLDNRIVQNQSGGGLYVVDGYVVARGNVIADNHKGFGIRTQQRFTYFQPSLFKQNRIYRNELGAVSIPDAKGAAPVLAENDIQEGLVAGADATLAIAAATFDPRTGQTMIRLCAPAAVESLVGRVVWQGDRWAVVATHGGDTITVWGDPSWNVDAAVNLLPDYR